MTCSNEHIKRNSSESSPIFLSICKLYSPRGPASSTNQPAYLVVSADLKTGSQFCSFIPVLMELIVLYKSLISLNTIENKSLLWFIISTHSFTCHKKYNKVYIQSVKTYNAKYTFTCVSLHGDRYDFIRNYC